jgi:hypothetical protein
MVAVGMVVALICTVGTAVTGVSAAEFSEAELFLELNDTDGGLGIHASIDGGPFAVLEIKDPRRRTILKITAQGRLAAQGLTQLVLASAESSSSDEPSPDTLLRQFPEGTYQIGATTLDGEELKTTVRLSHVLAAPPSNVRVSGVPAAESCDTVPLPFVPAGQSPVIDWDPVRRAHPTLGKLASVQIVRYQVHVEQGDVKFTVDLPPSVTRFQVPAAILASGGTFTFEVIARTATGNSTAVETCFDVE